MEIKLKGMPAPDLSRAAYIAPNAVVAGDVQLGEGSSVWFGAAVRGDGHPVRIGRLCNIQDNAVLHADEDYALTLGDYVSVGHGAIVHGCRLENSVLVGMNATILNGVQVGEGSLIAAGALVPENTLIPPHSLVMGIPARVKGPLTPQQREYVEANWKEYQKLSALYADAEE